MIKVTYNKGTKKNLAKIETKALKRLQENSDLVIRGADKGGGIVILTYSAYHQEAQRILNHQKYYRKVEKDPTPEIPRKLKEFLERAYKKAPLTKDEKSFLHVPFPSMAYFYFLPKVHKNEPSWQTDHLWNRISHW